jgi:glycosyltransferase involved in cell wall biosynthesis
MEDNIKNLIKESISKLEKKDFKIFFFVMDTKGNAIASIANIYEHVKILRDLGYDAQILHEKNDYVPMGAALGDVYAELPHVSIEAQQLKVNTHDFIVIPEIFANVMEQTAKLPSKRIVFVQSYDYIFEMLMPAKNWLDYGIKTVITTSEKQKNYVENLMTNKLNVEVIPVSIPEYFKPSDKPKKPIIAVSTRDQRDLVKLYKSFYLKYPHLKWVSFRDMKGLPREVFAKSLAESCLAIWVDKPSAFGTFPVEAMKCDVPVLGLVPDMLPEWIADKNGLWTQDPLAIVDLAANYFQAWLEDGEPQELYDEMSKIKEQYTVEQQKNKINEVYSKIFQERIEELKSNLPLEVSVENNVETQN